MLFNIQDMEKVVCENRLYGNGIKNYEFKDF